MTLLRRFLAYLNARLEIVGPAHNHAEGDARDDCPARSTR